MHRFYLSPGECRQPGLTLSQREAHHALHVLRIQDGERVTVLDGEGAEILCEARISGAGAVSLRVIQRHEVPRLSFHITLFQAVTKGPGMETIIQKATELGVSRIVPILSDRTVARPEGSRLESRVEKWRNIAIEALKQCGSPWLPEIVTPVSPAEGLRRHGAMELLLVGSLQSGARHPAEYFARHEAMHGRPPASTGVWVGPEGDFTPAEMNTLRAGGALPISLGPRVLRSDTAAVYCLAVINHELHRPRIAAQGPGDLPAVTEDSRAS